jgi:hypothetical protein
MKWKDVFLCGGAKTIGQRGEGGRGDEYGLILDRRRDILRAIRGISKLLH